MKKTENPRPNLTRVGELMSEITRRRTTEGRFRFNMPVQDALDLLTAMYQYEVQRRQCRFVLDSNTEGNLAMLARFLTQPAPKFGVICCGTCGNGKTTLLYAFQRAVNYLQDKGHFSFLDDEYRKFKAKIQILDAKEICRAATDDKHFKELKSMPMLAIDDLGKEPVEVQNFGNVLNPVIDLIDYRYNLQLFTFVTTNLTGSEVREKYKDRIADRFNEMFHKIVFKDISYRK